MKKPLNHFFALMLNHRLRRWPHMKTARSIMIQGFRSYRSVTSFTRSVMTHSNEQLSKDYLKTANLPTLEYKTKEWKYDGAAVTATFIPPYSRRMGEEAFVAIFKLLWSNNVSTRMTHESILTKLYPSSVGIIKASVLTINPELYTCIRSSGNMVCDCYDQVINHVGRTSFESEVTLSEKSMGRVFVKYVDKILQFDVKTRKIIELEKLKNELITRNFSFTASSINIKPTPPVLPVFTSTRVVKAEQVDHNNHLSGPLYVVMAVNVIKEANHHNFFKQPSYDFTSTGMKIIHLEQVHQGEALLGDELVFTVWWDVDVIKIQVTKNTSTNVAYLVIGLDKNTQSHI